MTNAENTGSKVMAAPLCVGSAEGMEKRHWFVAVVKNNTEKATGEKLSKAGYDFYLPIQTEYKIWKNGRKAKVNRVIIPTIIFIHCTDKERLEILSQPYIIRFMTNKACSAKVAQSKPIAVIPDEQIETLRFMVGNSDTPVSFVSNPFHTGGKVRVIRGNLTGLEGYVTRINDEQSELTVSIDFLGCAILTIKSINLEPIPTPTAS